MTFIALDDEPLALVLIRKFAQDLPEWNLLATFTDAAEASVFLQNNTVDLLLSDINMPDVNGLQFVRDLPDEHPMVIFVTAYKEHAHEGFNLDVVDYLVKPVQISLLVKAVEKAIRLRNATSTVAERLDTLKQNLKDKALKRIALPVADRLIFVELADIIYLEADSAYTHVILQDGSKLLISKKLKEFETVLTDNRNFFRVHRSFLINTDAIKQYIRSDGGSILMSNNTSVPIARERKEDFQKLIDDIRL
jgi:two-component system LytT family response regulator